jgi:hypothetical protein
MINQWEKIPSLQCEYDVEVLCLPNGLAVLDEVKIYPVCFNLPIFFFNFKIYLNLLIFS